MAPISLYTVSKASEVAIAPPSDPVLSIFAIHSLCFPIAATSASTPRFISSMMVVMPFTSAASSSIGPARLVISSSALRIATNFARTPFNAESTHCEARAYSSTRAIIWWRFSASSTFMAMGALPLRKRFSRRAIEFLAISTICVVSTILTSSDLGSTATASTSIAAATAVAFSLSASTAEGTRARSSVPALVASCNACALLDSSDGSGKL